MGMDTNNFHKLLNALTLFMFECKQTNQAETQTKQPWYVWPQAKVMSHFRCTTSKMTLLILEYIYCNSYASEKFNATLFRKFRPCIF